jgi:beta-glucosidase-like glycosyl hydrolase
MEATHNIEPSLPSVVPATTSTPPHVGMSQCGAITDIFTQHNYTSDWNETMRAALHDGGTDVACDSAYPTYLYAAYQNGSISLGDLQSAATNLFRQASGAECRGAAVVVVEVTQLDGSAAGRSSLVQRSTNICVPARAVRVQVFAIGLMDPPALVPYTAYGPERVDTAAHRQLAFEAAIQGIVLLQNNASANSPNGPGTPLLPLQRARLAGKKVAVVGPNAAATQTLLSNYHGTNTLVQNQSVYAALLRVGAMAGFSVTTAPGCIDAASGNTSIACVNSTGFAAALAEVAGADVALVVVGLCSDNCPDAGDRNVHEGEG